MTTTARTAATDPDPAADTWINRVNALLAKAESTEFAEEAEALVAKAQELMARHAIDDAVLQAAGRQATDAVISDTIVIAAPYASAKAVLLGAIAVTNNCRCVMAPAGSGSQRCVVIGHEQDLANVRTLFGSLSMHAVRSMLAAAVPPHDTTRRFRHAFLLSFAGRISERLQEASRAARREAEADATSTAGPAGSSGLEVVLASRQEAVDRAFAEAFPRTRTMRSTSSSAAGRVSGRRAADRAGLGQRSVGGRARGLSSG